MSKNQPPIIQLKNVSKTYKNSNVVTINDLNLTVQKGESIALLGPNCSGKTTTIKLIVGLLKPDHGQVECLGVEPIANRNELTKKIGLVFGPSSELWNEITLLENIELQERLYRLSKAQLDHKIQVDADLFDLKHLLNRKPESFSTGEKMRSLLFVKCLHQPELLILDEPTLGIDIQYKQEIRSFIKKMNEAYQTTILLTSHDLGDIEAISNRIIILNQGSIICDESIDSLKSKNIMESQVITNYVPLESIILNYYKKSTGR